MIEAIEKHLGTVPEATAKAIAAATGLPQIDVSRTLHWMLNNGAVERVKRAGGGNEYVYWLALAAALPAVDAPPAAAITETPEAAAPAGANDAARVIDEVRAEVERLTAENDELRQTAETWRANCAELEARIDELTLGPVGARAPLFVTVGRNSKPQRHDSIEKAQKRGRALVRAYKESEVLVLEPVGRIVRGTEWMPR